MKNIIIIARSGRMLASSAYSLGYKVHVLDYFADEDTQAVSSSTYQLEYSCDGFDEIELCEQVKKIVVLHADSVIVTGTGFEKQAELLDSLALIAPLLSNAKHVVRQLKDPVSLFSLLKDSSIRTPEFSLSRPNDREGWLVKMIGGVGGGHVQWLTDIKQEPLTNCYYQKHCRGNVCSAVFLASGADAKIVGFNEQMQIDTFPNMPFLYKGVISTDDVLKQAKRELEQAVSKITKVTGLKGLCGIDYVINEKGQIVVLEINPRPPASYEMHEISGDLFAAHLQCFISGIFEYAENKSNKIRGYEIYYSEVDVKIDAEIDWPNWVKDIPPSGSTIMKEFPVCTVHAEGDSVDVVKVLLENKIKTIKTIIYAEQHAA